MTKVQDPAGSWTFFGAVGVEEEAFGTWQGDCGLLGGNFFTWEF